MDPNHPLRPQRKYNFSSAEELHGSFSEYLLSSKSVPRVKLDIKEGQVVPNCVTVPFPVLILQEGKETTLITTV